MNVIQPIRGQESLYKLYNTQSRQVQIWNVYFVLSFFFFFFREATLSTELSQPNVPCEEMRTNVRIQQLSEL